MTKSKKSRREETSSSEEDEESSSSSSSDTSSSSSSDESAKRSKKSKKKSAKQKKAKRSTKKSSSSSASQSSDSDDSKGSHSPRKRKLGTSHGESKRPKYDHKSKRPSEEDEKLPTEQDLTNRSKWDSPTREHPSDGRSSFRNRDRRTEQPNRHRDGDHRGRRDDDRRHERPRDARPHDRDYENQRDRDRDRENDRNRNRDRRRYEDDHDQNRNWNRDRDVDRKYQDRWRDNEDRGRRGHDADRRDRRENNFKPRGSRNFPGKKEDDDGSYEWGRRVKEEKDDEPPAEKQKPDFGLSGKLTEDSNKVNGIVIKYAEPLEARKPKRRWRLYPFKGEKALPTLYIHRQSCYLIGRDRKVCDLPVDHPSCSKQHAALQYRLVPFDREDGTVGKRVRPYIIDLESANGTFLNNKPIEPRKYIELMEKDVLKFGFSSREYVLLHENSKEDQLDDDVAAEEVPDVQIKEEAVG